MPALTNPKHEAFAQQLIIGQKHGWTQGAAYSRAGYSAEGKTAEVNASRLLSNAKNGIAARVAELAGAGARRAEVTTASLLEKLDRVYDGASAAAQYSAAGRAVETQAKIAGITVDRVEIGAPGSFPVASTAETLQMIERELGPPHAAAFASLLEREDDEMVARFILTTMPLDEALLRQDQLREAFLRVASEKAVTLPTPHTGPGEAELGLRLLQRHRL